MQRNIQEEYLQLARGLVGRVGHWEEYHSELRNDVARRIKVSQVEMDRFDCCINEGGNAKLFET